MTVILVILTFATFIAIDMIMNRKKALVTAMEPVAEATPESAGVDVVAGYAVPANVRYHPGHAWLLRERKNVNRVGADAFAAALAGPVDRIELPKPGVWVRQGQKIISLFRNGEKIEMVSPVEGEVVEINAEVVANPALLREDPYGKGWLMSVFAPDEDGPARNLLPSNLVPVWMREAADRLFQFQPQLAGATAADGGVAVRDVAASMDVETWKRAAHEFLLS